MKPEQVKKSVDLLAMKPHEIWAENISISVIVNVNNLCGGIDTDVLNLLNTLHTFITIFFIQFIKSNI